MEQKKRKRGTMKLALTVGAAAMLMTSCLEEGNRTIVLPVQEETIPARVIDATLLEEIEQSGVEIHTGSTPPNIEGEYVISPMEMVYASDGYQMSDFYDLHIRFAEQQKRGMIYYSEMQNDTVSGNAIGAYVIGEGDNFTMYGYQWIGSESGSWRCKLSTIITGRKVADGLADLRYVVVVTESERNNPNEDPGLAEDGTYRVFVDGDGLAKKE